jgi:hypothetical protein
MRCSEPGGASRLQSWRPVRRVAELWSLGGTGRLGMNVTHTSDRFSTTDYTDDTDVFLSVPIRGIRGSLCLSRQVRGVAASAERFGLGLS